MSERRLVTLDGNEAAASVAFRTSEVALRSGAASARTSAASMAESRPSASCCEEIAKLRIELR